MTLTFRILGSLEVYEDGRELPLGRGRQRAVLALLLLHLNEVVSSERLIEDLWAGKSPASAAKVLQGYISQLRRALPADTILTRGQGYCLAAAETDAGEFELLVRAAAGQDAARAVETLGRAHALWRGRPFQEFEYEEWAQVEIARLEELRLVAVEHRLEAELELGRHAQAIPELESLVAEHPLREQLRGLLMVALYRCGRQADALEVYRHGRHVLHEELGLDPSPSLQELERQMLNHDSTLETTASPKSLFAGTVTFLFTDIEGSTRLLRQLGDAYGDVLADHRGILRSAAAEHDGREVDTQGDSFFFAFARANAALGAAVDAQRALDAHEWPDGARVRVRMGLHTAEATIRDDRYVGLGVHRAARIGAVAHGGQVVLSTATRELVEESRDGVTVRELGSYRLKDFDRPERLFQLDVDGLQTDFPPLTAQTATKARPRRRRVLALAAATAAVAVGIVVPILAFTRGGDQAAAAAATANSLGVIDARTGQLTADVPVGASPAQVAVGAGSYWVSNTNGGTVTRIDAAAKRVIDTITVGNSPSGITTGNGAVWVANGLDGTVSRIDPSTNDVVQTIDVGNGPQGITSTPGAVWVANTTDSTITRIDASTGVASKPLPIPASELAAGAGSLWATERTANRVVRIDPKTGRLIQPIAVGNGPAGIAAGHGAVWVTNALDGTVSRIDPSTNAVTAVVRVGNGPTAIAVGKDGVWVSNQYDGTLVRIDPHTNLASNPTRVGNRPQGVAFTDGTLLVDVRQSDAGHRGGTIVVRMNRDLDSIDPAVAYDSTSIPIMRMTHDGLVAMNQASGLAGTQLVPDLAVSLPVPTDNGRTYTFQLRPNIRYSNGRPLQASDFRHSIERDYVIGKLPVQYYDDIVGAATCARQPGKRCDLSRGIVADDAAGTVTFHLVRPDPEFLYQLTLGFGAAVPGGARLKEAHTHPVPGTGPYVVESYRPKTSLTLRRNPYFREWSKAAQPDGYPDRITYRIGGTPERAIDDVISGKADAFSTSQSETPPSKTYIDTVTLQHASQVHPNPQPATIALFLNTRVPPFNQLAVRRAVNYAADREAAVEANGGPEVAQATCQVLPPHFPGYRPYCPYGTQPDLAKARALVRASGTTGMRVTFWSWAALPSIGPYAVRLLQSLGYRVSLRTLPVNPYFGVIGDSRNRAAAGTNEWISDYPAPGGFIAPLFTCSAFKPRSSVNQNTTEFCDPKLDRQIEDALGNEVTDPEIARRQWERVDRAIVDEAVWVPLVNPKQIDVVSKRVGNYQSSPNGAGIPVDQLWVR